MISNTEIERIKNLISMGWLERMACEVDGLVLFPTENINKIFSETSVIFEILNKYLKKEKISSTETNIAESVIDSIGKIFNPKNYERYHEYYQAVRNFLVRLHDSNIETFKGVVIESKTDLSSFYQERDLRNIDFVLDILNKSQTSYEHDRKLIKYFEDFFKKDSQELREIIIRHPRVYDRLAKCGCKPNFPKEFIVSLVAIHGPHYFTSRLSGELKDDDEFMSHVIMSDPTNIFRGRSRQYNERIRKNAFFLFGDRHMPIFGIEGIMYILEHIPGTDAIDMFEYINNVCDLSSIWKKNEHIFRKYLKEEQIELLRLRRSIPLDEKQVSIMDKYSYGHKDNKKFYDQYPEEYRYKLPALAGYARLNLEYYELDISIKELFNSYLRYYNKDVDSAIFMNGLCASIKNGTIDIFTSIARLEDGKFIQYIDFNFFTKEIIDKLGIENIKNIAYYPNSLYIFTQIVKEGSLDLYVELLKENKNNQNYMAPAIDINLLLYATYTYKDTIIDMKSKGLLTKENIKKLIDITRTNKIVPINSSEDVINYDINMVKLCDKEIDKCNDVSYAKELLFLKYLRMNREQAQEFIFKYKEALKEKNSSYYPLLETLELIDSSINIKSIKKAYHALSKLKVLKQGINNIEEIIKKEVIGDEFLTKTIGRDGFKCKERFHEDGVDIRVLDPNEPFQLLVHSLGAYGGLPKGNSTKDIWNTTSRSNVSGLCTSLITDDFMATAASTDSIILGFDKNITSETIFAMAPFDVYSTRENIVLTSSREQQFFSSDSLPNHCRGARANYSEIVISRYMDGTNSKKRQPDYVICFDYLDNNAHYKAMQVAKEFGVPLIYIKTSKFCLKNYNDINGMVEDFKNNPTLTKAINIMNRIEKFRVGYSSIPNIRETTKNYKGLISIDKMFDKSYSFYYLKELLSDKDKELFDESIKEMRDMRKLGTYEKDKEKVVSEAKGKSRVTAYKKYKQEMGLIDAYRLEKIRKQVIGEGSEEDGKRRVR